MTARRGLIGSRSWLPDVDHQALTCADTARWSYPECTGNPFPLASIGPGESSVAALSVPARPAQFPLIQRGWLPDLAPMAPASSATWAAAAAISTRSSAAPLAACSAILAASLTCQYARWLPVVAGGRGRLPDGPRTAPLDLHSVRMSARRGVLTTPAGLGNPTPRRSHRHARNDPTPAAASR